MQKSSSVVSLRRVLVELVAAAQLLLFLGSSPVFASILIPQVGWNLQSVVLKPITVPATTLVPSGPILIDGQQDVVISGLHITNPNGHCIEIKNGASNVTIENSEIGPCGDMGIKARESNNITVRNNYIHDTASEAVLGDVSHHIAVDSNVFINVRSAYRMVATGGGHLSFTHNFVKNISRNTHDAGGNVAQLAWVRGGQIRITDNVAVNVLGESNPEDLVSVFKSHGTANDPILVSRNKFKGGGPSTSGGGILAPDQDGSYIVVEDNILLNPGQYGLQIGGGHHNTLRNNKVLSDKDQPFFANVGLPIIRYNYGGAGTQPGDCYGHTVENNKITWFQSADSEWNNRGSAFLHPTFVPGRGSDNVAPNCGAIAGWSTNKFDNASAQPANLDASLLWDSAWDSPSFLPQNPYYLKHTQ